MRRSIALLLFVLAFAAMACGPASTPAPTAAPTKPAAPAATTAPAPAATTAAVVAPTAAKPARGGSFTDSSFADAATMSPLLSQDTASSAYVGLTYASLTRLDPKSLEVIGNLYEAKPTLSADGATLTWKLRQGLKWSDGSPITAKDIEFTWKQMMDEKGKFPYRALYADSFKSVVAKDDFTVEYTMKTPGFCPAVINSGLVSPVPAAVFSKFDNVWQNDANNKPTVYSGLFGLKEWQKDNFASFSPGNASFVRGQPNLDSYVYRIVKDNTVNTQLFKTQEVDVAAPDPVDWDEVSKLPHAQAYRYYPASGASWTYIGFNLRNPVLSDKRVRQAISYAINKQEFIDKIRLGFAKPQYSIYHATSWAYTDDVKKYDYSVQKAKDLLKEAGYTPGSDGILQKDGKPLKLRIHYNAGNKQREQISVISQQYLKDVGISAEVIAEEWTAYLDRVNKNFDMDMYVLGWSTGIEPNGMGNIWKSDGGQNSTGYKNPEIDKLFNDAANVPGCAQADRKKIYDKIQQILAEDAPYVFLYTSEALVVYNKRVQVNPLSPLGLSYQVEQWAVNKATP